MKKYIAILLLVCMLAGLIAGCGEPEAPKIKYSEYYTGKFSVSVPEGWKAFPYISGGETDPYGVYVCKGASEDDDPETFPGVEFHALATSVLSSVKEEVGTYEDANIRAGKRTWNGISFISGGKSRLYLEYADENIGADILLNGETKAINSSDEELIFILSSVVLDNGSQKPVDPVEPVDPASDALVISEIMADNDSYIVKGKLCDWIEIYNAGTEPLDLSDYSLSNNEAKFDQCPLSGTIMPNEYLLLLCNNEEIVFNISKFGESLFLFDRGGNMIQRVDIPELSPDKSFVVGEGECDQPTPGFSNDSDGYFAYIAQNTADIVINEVIASNSKHNAVDGKYYDMIEIKNVSEKTVNLGDYCLSDDKNELTGSPLPDKELAPGEFYVYPASGSGSKYAQFKISASGETVYLSDRQGNIVDIIRVPELPTNMSYGRIGDGYAFFATPSLGKENSGGSSSLLDVPAVSVPEGFYAEAQKITLSGEGKIYYTTDGSDPSAKGSLYKGEEINVSKTLGLRVCAKNEDGISSRVATYNYFIDVPDYALSVVKVTVDHNDMFGSAGIWTNYNKSWEKPANVSMYTDGKLDFSINCGVKIFGGGSRAEAKKSLALKFRSSYGVSSLKYEVFPGYDVKEFDSLVLRSGVETMSTTVFRDEIAAELALSGNEFSSTYVQNYRPVDLYINGEYYGIYFIREKLDDHYVESHLGVPADTVTVIECKEGSATSEMGKLISYMENHNMNDPVVLQYVSDRVDIDCFIDYYILRAYTGDKDYPNIRFFKSSQGDGKWRVMFYDVDWGFYSANASSPFGSYFSQYHHTMGRNSAIMYLLLKNDTVKDKFLKRTAHLLNTALSVESLNTAVDKLTEMIRPDIEYDRKRWGFSVSSWEKAIGSVKSFVEKRNNQMINDAKEVFNLSSAQVQTYFPQSAE